MGLTFPETLNLGDWQFYMVQYSIPEDPTRSKRVKRVWNSITKSGNFGRTLCEGL